MSEDDSAFIRCVRHPSQFFTGFCSSCLVERLSNVSKPCEHSLGACNSVESEIVEVPDTGSFSEAKSSEVRVRKTLQLLFQLDDVHGLENDEQNTDCHQELLNSSQNGSGVSCHHKCSISENVEGSSSTENRAMESNVNSIGDVPQDEKNNICFNDEVLSKRWLSSMFMRKKSNWRSMSVSSREELQERCKSCTRFEVDQLTRSPNICQHLDGAMRSCHHPIKTSWDPPRHSWDGSTVGKAFACSFACLEEREDNSTMIKRRLPVQPPSEAPNDRRRGQADPKSLADDKTMSDSSLGELFAERDREGSLPESSVLKKTKGKKVHRWSKVWDWSIASPSRDLVKKREKNSERSMSESWREGRNDRGGAHLEAGTQYSSFCLNSARISQFKHHSMSSSMTNSVNLRPDWLKKRDFQLNRSQSLHYSTPGNFNNGLLRFYLTPLRSSRRITNKSRDRRSRSYARGIFGLH